MGYKEMEPFVLEKEQFFAIDDWMQRFPGLVAGFTTKNGGNSKESYDSLNLGYHVGDTMDAVCTNRKKLSNVLDFPLQGWVGAEQTHGITIRKITRSDRGRGSDSYADAFKATDGFYTREQGILLTLCFADCVPLFFIAPEERLIGVAHAGWKGTVSGIAAEMISAWNREGVNVEKISVVIGPSICKKCYIVDDRVITLVQNTLEHVEKKPYNLIQEGQYSLDLREVNKQILIQAGISEKKILSTEFCSSCHNTEFFSHRRDSGRTGRMLSFIGWREF
jgi:polyphenol oxidase